MNSTIEGRFWNYKMKCTWNYEGVVIVYWIYLLKLSSGVVWICINAILFGMTEGQCLHTKIQQCTNPLFRLWNKNSPLDLLHFVQSFTSHNIETWCSWVTFTPASCRWRRLLKSPRLYWRLVLCINIDTQLFLAESKVMD